MRLEESRFIAQSYFAFQSDCAALRVGTSKNLFSKHPHRPTVEQLIKAIQEYCPPNLTQIEALHRALVQSLVPQWDLQLRVGFNLALYGYGSKGKLMEEFVEGYVQDYQVFLFRAYNRNASFLEPLLQMASTNGIGLSGAKRTVAVGQEIARQLQRRTGKVLLILLHADAPCMCNEDSWQALLALAMCPNVRMILSFEHLNALSLLDSAGWARLNLLWHDATTMRPYGGEELLALISRKARLSDAAGRWKGAQFVLTSLTRTARGIFCVLAEHQLQNATDRDNDNGADDDEDHATSEWGWGVVPWYQRCQEQFLVSNEMAFRTQLAEFLDHELVKACGERGQNGTDFYIPFDRSQIEHLIEICQN